MTTAEYNTFAGLYKWWIKESIRLNDQSFGLTFNSPGSASHNMRMFFYTDENSGTMAFVRPTATPQDLAINMRFYGDLTSDVNGVGHYTYKVTYADGSTDTKVADSAYLDRTLAHEFNHAILGANEGIAELVAGCDDERGSTIFELASGAATVVGGETISRLKKALEFESGTGTGDRYCAGPMLLRYIAKQGAFQTLFSLTPSEIVANVLLSASQPDNTAFYVSTDGTDKKPRTATTEQTAAAIELGTASGTTYNINKTDVKQNILVTGSTGWTINDVQTNVSVTGGDGGDLINGLSGTYYIDGGSGDDKISIAGGSNLTIKGSSGNNTITGTANHIYSYVERGSGNDSIKFFGTGTTIDAGGGNNTIFIKSGSGTDRIIYLANNSTVFSGDGNDYIEDDGLYQENNYVDAGDGADILQTYGLNSTIHGGDGNDTIYIRNESNNVYGDAGSDIIKLTNYTDMTYAVKNTVVGGLGNDTIEVNYNDNVVYTGGDADVVSIASGVTSITLPDLTSEDTIKFSKEITSMETVDGGLKVNYSDCTALTIKLNINQTIADILDVKVNDNETIKNYFPEYVPPAPFSWTAGNYKVYIGDKLSGDNLNAEYAKTASELAELTVYGCGCHELMYTDVIMSTNKKDFNVK